MNKEQQRLSDKASRQAWRMWGPYLSERQWGTVREDYSPDGNAWAYFPFGVSHQRAYRWGEDGIGGFSDHEQRLCLSLALWNGHDPLLKERLFGLGGPEGNHAEDVKECYYYLDGLPSHAYMRMLYKYPHQAFPYDELREVNRRRGKHEPEYELWDTGVFERGYFDIEIEYAKSRPEDLILRVTATNRGTEKAMLHLLPHVWFRNTWTWDHGEKPVMERASDTRLALKHPDGLNHHVACSLDTCLFTENETNPACFGHPAESGYFKDAFHQWLINGQKDAINPAENGTKAAFHGAFDIEPGGSRVVTLRLSDAFQPHSLNDSDAVVDQRKAECDIFYHDLQQGVDSDDRRLIQRQAYAGMLWTKQVYHYHVSEWLNGDPAFPPPPDSRKRGRNHTWKHLANCDVVSMPDKWEYPWYAVWDSAFHCVPLAEIDPDFAKDQMLLFLENRYLHPNGQIPAYEWNFNDVNPPVHAWGALEVYEIDRACRGRPDRLFLEKVFQKLLLNFTWWVNRKDRDDNNVFEGGFLGLDNIGIFNRSEEVPGGGRLDQADGTGWMAMYCLNMFRMATELAEPDNAYEDMACKFFEHFLFIAGAMHDMGGFGIGLWDDEDDFYHDIMHAPGREPQRLRLRSMVGLIPLYAVEVFNDDRLQALPRLQARMNDLKLKRQDLAKLVSRWDETGDRKRHLMAIARAYRMTRVLQRVLDRDEFLAPHGIRALSKAYRDTPFRMQLGHEHLEVRYTPGESDTMMFGGNSNWRGPIWFPVNYMLVHSLKKYHAFYGDDFLIEYPSGSGEYKHLGSIARELSSRLISLFEQDADGRRPVWGDHPTLQRKDFRDHLLFFEYFNGDDGRGHGASHQTGWTGLVASLIREQGQTGRETQT